MRRAYCLMISMLFVNAASADSVSYPKLNLDDNYIIYQTIGEQIVFDEVYPESNWCINEISGKPAQLWILRGGTYNVTIGGCDQQSVSKDYRTNKLLFGEDKPMKSWQPGILVIKPTITKGFRGELTTQEHVGVVTEFLNGVYPVVTSYPPEGELYGNQVARIRKSYENYIHYDIECWGSGNDSDYGYYKVCKNAQDAGSYLYDIIEKKSIRLNSGVPISIRILFKSQNEIIVYGGVQAGKSAGYDCAYRIKDGSIKLIYKGLETGS